MEANIKEYIYIKTKESLEKNGLLVEKENIYNINMNQVNETFLKGQILWTDFLTTFFREYYSKNIDSKEHGFFLQTALDLLEKNSEQLPEKFPSIVEFLETKNILDKNELALDMMHYIYDSRIQDYKCKYDREIKDVESDFWADYKMKNPQKMENIYKNNDLDEYREFDLAKKEYMKNWFIQNFGTTKPLNSIVENFYRIDLKEDSFYFIIANTLLNEHGINIDSTKIKELHANKGMKYKKTKSEKQNLTPLQQREEELVMLEKETRKLEEELKFILKEDYHIGE